MSMSDIQKSVGSFLQPKNRRPSLVCSVVTENSKSPYIIRCLYGFQPKPRHDSDVLIRADIKSQAKNTTVTKNLFVSLDTENTGKCEIYARELNHILSKIEEEIDRTDKKDITIKIGVFLDVQIEEYHSHLSEFNTDEKSEGLLFNPNICWEKTCESYIEASLDFEFSKIKEVTEKSPEM